MKMLRLIGMMMAVAVIAVSCTKEIEIEIPETASQLVVEGTIENGVPPIILLTRSAKIFSKIEIGDISSFFVHDAEIVVSAGSDSVRLQEFCLQNLNLPPDQLDQVLRALGFTLADSSILPNICIYTVPDILNYFLNGTAAFTGKENTTYELYIRSGNEVARASTRIPTALGLDSLAVRPHPNAGAADSLAAVYAYFTVPNTYGNFVRYWTKRNSEQFYTPRSQSVYDDRLFSGLSIGLPLERGQSPSEKIDINTYSYFWKGDTASVKWANIDYQTFDFYYTLENDGQGPFSSPVRIKSNLSGALGVWAGYASRTYTIVVPR